MAEHCAGVRAAMRAPDVQQHPWELAQAVKLCRSLHPARILEIGTFEGGTLKEWLQIASEAVVVVDDRMRWERDWREWAADSRASLQLVKGLSQHRAIIEKAAALGPYDWVFIDADHSAAAVRLDWESYRPMVAPGGAVAFHDILPYQGLGVADLWAEIRASELKTHEIVRRKHRGSIRLAGIDLVGGIGVVWP